MKMNVASKNVASLLIGLTLCAGSQVRAEVSDPTASLEAFHHQAFELDLSPGMAVAVVRGDQIIYSRGFGYADLEARRPVTPETLFYIASTTKTLTAMAAAQLHHRSELDLNKSLSHYLPTMSLHPELDASEISVRDLLTHTHGIDNDGPLVFRTAFSGRHSSDLLNRLIAEHGPAEQGRAFDYGNLGYNLAGMVLEAVTGKSWKDVVEQEVLAPAGMKSTTARRSKADEQSLAWPYRPTADGYERAHYGKNDSNMHAAGGHLTGVLDLARYLLAHLNEGRIDGRQVFARDAVAETHRPQADQDRDFSFFHRHGWGLGWDLGTYEGAKVIHRFGSFPGFWSHVSFMPEHDLGVVVLVNGHYFGGRLAMLTAVGTYDHLLGKDGLETKHQALLQEYRESSKKQKTALARELEKRRQRPQAPSFPLTTYVGSYQNASLGTMEWQIEQGRLVAEMGVMRSPAEVYKLDENQLRVELMGRGQVIVFGVPEKGQTEPKIRTFKYMDEVFTRIETHGEHGENTARRRNEGSE